MTSLTHNFLRLTLDGLDISSMNFVISFATGQNGQQSPFQYTNPFEKSTSIISSLPSFDFDFCTRSSIKDCKLYCEIIELQTKEDDNINENRKETPYGFGSIIINCQYSLTNENTLQLQLGHKILIPFQLNILNQTVEKSLKTSHILIFGHLMQSFIINAIPNIYLLTSIANKSMSSQFGELNVESDNNGSNEYFKDEVSEDHNSITIKSDIIKENQQEVGNSELVPIIINLFWAETEAQITEYSRTNKSDIYKGQHKVQTHLYHSLIQNKQKNNIKSTQLLDQKTNLIDNQNLVNEQDLTQLPLPHGCFVRAMLINGNELRQISLQNEHQQDNTSNKSYRCEIAESQPASITYEDGNDEQQQINKQQQQQQLIKDKKVINSRCRAMFLQKIHFNLMDYNNSNDSLQPSTQNKFNNSFLLFMLINPQSQSPKCSSQSQILFSSLFSLSQITPGQTHMIRAVDSEKKIALLFSIYTPQEFVLSENINNQIDQKMTINTSQLQSQQQEIQGLNEKKQIVEGKVTVQLSLEIPFNSQNPSQFTSNGQITQSPLYIVTSRLVQSRKLYYGRASMNAISSRQILSKITTMKPLIQSGFPPESFCFISIEVNEKERNGKQERLKDRNVIKGNKRLYQERKLNKLEDKDKINMEKMLKKVMNQEQEEEDKEIKDSDIDEDEDDDEQNQIEINSKENIVNEIIGNNIILINMKRIVEEVLYNRKTWEKQIKRIQNRNEVKQNHVQQDRMKEKEKRIVDNEEYDEKDHYMKQSNDQDKEKQEEYNDIDKDQQFNLNIQQVFDSIDMNSFSSNKKIISNLQQQEQEEEQTQQLEQDYQWA